jgi:DNA-binding NarL/FixJ family response regulator
MMNSMHERPRLILSDDHPDMLSLVVRLLQTEAEILGTVTDGAAAVEAVHSCCPDVLITDISMPGLSGIEVARRLTAEGTHIKVVFLTVIEDRDFVREAFAAGGVGYVIKSRLTKDLPCALHEVLAGHTFISPSLEPYA